MLKKSTRTRIVALTVGTIMVLGTLLTGCGSGSSASSGGTKKKDYYFLASLW